jgi:hypothetical protein
MNAAHKQKVLAITRHPPSLDIVKKFIEGPDVGADFRAVAMDAIVHPEALDEALKTTARELENADLVIVGTKVFDRVAGQNNLPELVTRMQHNMSLCDKPLILTNLGEFSFAEEAEILAIHMNTTFVYHDNISTNGMKNLAGPVRQGSTYNSPQLPSIKGMPGLDSVIEGSCRFLRHFLHSLFLFFGVTSR